MTGLDGANEYLNQRWCEYTGVPKEQASGFAWLEAIHLDDRVQTLSSWSLVREAGEKFETNTH